MSSKGKKYDAAEKHFLLKEERYKKQLKSYALQSVEVENLKKEILDLRMENTDLKEMLNKALELKDISKEDIKAKIEAEKAMLSMYGFLMKGTIPRNIL